MDLAWNVRDADSHYMVNTYFRVADVPSGARQRTEAAKHERRRRQNAARKARKTSAPDPQDSP